MNSSRPAKGRPRNLPALIKATLRDALCGFLIALQVYTPFAWRTIMVRNFGIYAGGFLAVGTNISLTNLALSTFAQAQEPPPSSPPPLSQERQEIQNYSRGLIPNPQSLVTDAGNGQLQFLPGTDATFTQSAQSINQANQAPPQENPNAYDGDNQKIISEAYRQSEVLDQETPGSGTGLGEAYRLVKGAKNNAHPDLRNDPLIQSSGSIYANRDQLAPTFANCSTSPTRTTATSTNHVPDYRLCERVNAKSGQETLIHDYTVLPPITITARSGTRAEPAYTCDANGNNCVYTPTITQIASQSGVTSCGSGCLDVFLGQVGDNYLAGECTVYEQNLDLNLPVPTAITSATFIYAMWDDYYQVFINDNKIFQGPNANFPPETPGDCELKTQFSASPNTDVTAAFRNTNKVSIKTRVSVFGNGEGYGTLRILYSTPALIQDRGYTPPQAVNLSQATGDAQCVNAAVTPTRTPAIDGDGCAIVNDIKVCAGDFPPPPSRNINPLWQEMAVSANCNPSYGTFCWTDINGQQRCYTQDESNSTGTNCSRLEDTPGCAFVSSQCLEGAQGQSGQCYVTEEKWDCGFDTTTSTYSINDVTTCEGSIQCIGESCVRPDRESSNDFAAATAAMTAVKMVATDSECRPDGKCFVFPGKHYNCKVAVGGVQNCCEGGVAPNLVQYLLLYEASTQVTAALSQLDVAQPIYGAWSSVSSQVSQTFSSYWSEIRQPFASIMDNLGASTLQNTSTEAGTQLAANTFMAEIKQQLLEKSYKLLADTFSDQVASQFVTQSTSSGVTSYALSEGVTNVANYAGYIMAAYTAYQVTMLLIQIVWACEAAELELNAKRQLKVCSHLGSYCKSKVLGQCIEKREVYCCYNSPLSRIMMEQINPQLNRPYGDLKNPDCSGLSIEQVEDVDFSKIDLSEWIGLLTLAGIMPDANGNTSKDYSIESITGTNSPLNTGASTGMPRANAIQRSQDRINNANVSDTRTNTQQQFYYGDPADADPATQPGNSYGNTGTPRDVGTTGTPPPDYNEADYYPPGYQGQSRPDTDTPAPAPSPNPTGGGPTGGPREAEGCDPRFGCQ